MKMKTMKTLSKRTLAMLLAFTMCFSMMHLSVYAAEAEPAPDFTLTVGEETKDLSRDEKMLKVKRNLQKSRKKQHPAQVTQSLFMRFHNKMT